MLSPYSLHYAARISVILLPWAGLGWMLALMVRALRKGGWRYPAAFAIVVQIVGSVNATALVFALLAPLLWVPYAVWITREVDWRRAVLTLARIGVLTLGASLWWISGLWAQGAYGIDILKYTETVKTVATAGVAPEVLRGLGYWFFYGGDKLGNWIEASVHYTQSRPLIVASYAVPTLALLAAAFIRWRHRFYFAVLMLIGLAIAVGAHPFDDPSPFGALLKAFADSSNAGLALRSVGRAVPLVALGAAVLLGAGVTAFVTLARPTQPAPVRARHHRARRRDRDRGAPGVVERRLLRQEPAATRGRPELLDPGDRRRRRPTARHPRAGDAGLRLRVLPVGEHGRPDHTRV